MVERARYHADHPHLATITVTATIACTCTSKLTWTSKTRSSLSYISHEKSQVITVVLNPVVNTDRTCGLRIVYKIPPLKVNEGYRANEWGNLSEPLWKGRLRIVEKGTTAALLFEDNQTGTSDSLTSAWVANHVQSGERKDGIDISS